MEGKVRISCSKPERVRALFEHKEIDGIAFTDASQLGLQVTFEYQTREELEEDEIAAKIKAFMKKDEVFCALITSIEVF
ncbi:MAG: hypothetical protein ACRDBO_13730 [Lachnospiraceae bacterium]